MVLQVNIAINVINAHKYVHICQNAREPYLWFLDAVFNPNGWQQLPIITHQYTLTLYLPHFSLHMINYWNSHLKTVRSIYSITIKHRTPWHKHHRESPTFQQPVKDNLNEMTATCIEITEYRRSYTHSHIPILKQPAKC
jgi:hypothetical protein